MLKTVVVYISREGREPFNEWLHGLKDKTTRFRIEARVDRISQGNFGDHKRFRGLLEIRLHFGKGYRLYCGEDGETIVALLFGGDKDNQEKDIGRALEYLEDYNETKKVQDI